MEKKAIELKCSEIEMIRSGINDSVNLLADDELSELFGGLHCGNDYCPPKNTITSTKSSPKYMRITKTVIILAALVAFGISNALSAQVKVELTANGVKKIPTKVTLFQDTAMVASQSFTDMAFVLPNVPFNRLKLEARNYQSLTQDYNQTDSILKFTLKRDTTVSLDEVVVTATTTMITNGANTKYLNVADGYLGQYWSGNSGVDTGTHENEWCDFRARAWCATDLY